MGHLDIWSDINNHFIINVLRLITFVWRHMLPTTGIFKSRKKVLKRPQASRTDFRAPDLSLVPSIEVAQVMGFGTTAALSCARKEGRLPFKMFRVEGRRVWFAWRSDMRAWLKALAESHARDEKTAPNHGAHG
jgi:hypothetical protein